MTQFDAASSGDETDQVLYLYDDWGNLTDFRQDYDDVVTNSSPNDLGVHYTYTKADTTSPTSGTRRSGLRRVTSGLYFGSGTSGSGTKKYEVTHTFFNGGSHYYDDDAGRVSYSSRTYPSSTVDLVDYTYGGVGTELIKYYLESAVRRVKAYGGTSGWDVGFDRFGRPYQSYWYNAQTYALSRVSYDDNSNITAVESPWVTPWSATYESDALNRLKGLEFGVMTTGSISTVVQKEDWQTSGALKLDQVGNWIDYKRVREGVTQDDWQGNTFSGINTYTNVALVGAADWVPEYDAKGLLLRDDSTVSTTKGYQYVYDAWDRLVTVKTPAGVVAEEFRYNGLGHRIGWHYDSNSSGTVNGSDPWVYFQHNEKWQEVAVWEGTNTTPREVFTYGGAGLDGYGSSSYLDDVVCRERDVTSNGSFDDRYYYLQNWRNDVVMIMDYDGAIKEKVFYDAYGRPHAFSPGDIKTAGGADRPDGLLDANDTWSTGSVLWNKDLGNSSGAAIPDGSVTAADGTTLTNLKAAGYSAGYGILSDSAIGNRKGYAGYAFDPVLKGAAGPDNKTFYHVRHRVLASDTGKWLQKDPLGYHDSMDLYEYCKSDAVENIDSMGLLAASTSASTSSCKNGCRMTARSSQAAEPLETPQDPTPSNDPCVIWCDKTYKKVVERCDDAYPPNYDLNTPYMQPMRDKNLTARLLCKTTALMCHHNCLAACTGSEYPHPVLDCTAGIQAPWSRMPWGEEGIPFWLPPFAIQGCINLAEGLYTERAEAARAEYDLCIRTAREGSDPRNRYKLTPLAPNREAEIACEVGYLLTLARLARERDEAIDECYLFMPLPEPGGNPYMARGILR